MTVNSVNSPHAGHSRHDTPSAPAADGAHRDGTGSLSLPALPPTFGGSDVTWRPGGRSALARLADEHDRLLTLAQRLAGPAETGHRRRLRDTLVAGLTRHLSAEEQYLYPAVRQVLPGGDRLAEGELATDHAMLTLLTQLSGLDPDDAEFAARLAETRTALRRHAHTATTRIFPRLRAALDPERLIRLGNRLAIAEEAAPTRPHPGTPSTPPWNKVVDPAVGVVDRLRDVLTGRTTGAPPAAGA